MSERESRIRERAHATRFYGAVALGVAAVMAGVVLRGRAWRDSLPRGETTMPDPAAIVEWCAEGLVAIAGGGCFAPPRPTSGAEPAPPTLLVYLHGRYAPESAAEELERQARVARHGTARGYAVLALRGMQGQCTDPLLATWWCWPSNERNAADGRAFVARWKNALDEAERRAGNGRRVLLGFSNGGYFAALIASRALVPFDAVAIAHAGPVEPMHPVGKTPPMFLVDADDDPSSPEILRLDGDLTRESWPHAMVIREGGHALPDWDVEMCLTFFDRSRTERFPLVPPLAPPRPPRPHDASVGDAEPAAESGAPDAGAPPEPEIPLPDAPDPPAPAPSSPVLDPPL